MEFRIIGGYEINLFHSHFRTIRSREHHQRVDWNRQLGVRMFHISENDDRVLGLFFGPVESTDDHRHALSKTGFEGDMYRCRAHIDIQILHYFGSRTRNREDGIFHRVVHGGDDCHVRLIESQVSVVHQVSKDVVWFFGNGQYYSQSCLYFLHFHFIYVRERACELVGIRIPAIQAIGS